MDHYFTADDIQLMNETFDLLTEAQGTTVELMQTAMAGDSAAAVAKANSVMTEWSDTIAVNMDTLISRNDELVKQNIQEQKDLYNQNMILSLILLAISFVAFLGFYLIANKNRFMSKQDNCIMKMLLLFLFLGAMNQGLMRIANYLIPFAIPYVVNVGYSLITMEKFAYNKILFIGCFAFLIFQKSYYYLADTSHLAVHTRQYELWYPYESVFKPIKHTHRELIFYNAMYNQSVIRTSGE